MSWAAAKERRGVLMLGLDAAGKTTNPCHTDDGRCTRVASPRLTVLGVPVHRDLSIPSKCVLQVGVPRPPRGESEQVGGEVHSKS